MSGLVLASQTDQTSFGICNWSDAQINDLLDAINAAVNGTGETMADGFYTKNNDGKIYNDSYSLFSAGVDPQSGAGALLIDRMMSELSNLESISANAVATSQRIQKEINSKLS